MSNIKKISIVLIVILVLGILAWAFPYAQGWYRARQAMQYYNEQIALHQADKYGGDTPEQTWEMFLTALRAQDFDLASKYFVLKKQEEWKGNLVRTYEAGDMPLLMKEITVAPWQEVAVGDIVAEYEINDNDGQTMAYIIMEKNINNKWKLRSF